MLANAVKDASHRIEKSPAVGRLFQRIVDFVIVRPVRDNGPYLGNGSNQERNQPMNKNTKCCCKTIRSIAHLNIIKNHFNQNQS